MKLKNIKLDVKKTLGTLKFLRCEAKPVFQKPNEFTYNIALLSTGQEGEILLTKFPKKVDFPFDSQVELVGEVTLTASVVTAKYGSTEINSVDFKLEVEDIKLVGNNNQGTKEDKK